MAKNSTPLSGGAHLQQRFNGKKSKHTSNCIVKKTVHDATEFVNIELYRFLDSIDPWKWKEHKVSEYEKNIELIDTQITSLVDGLKLSSGENELRLSVLFESFLSKLPPKRSISRNKQDWIELFNQLIPDYVEISELMQNSGCNSRTLRYSNLTRSIFHVFNATCIVMLFEFILTPRTAIVVATTAALLGWICEGIKAYNDTFKYYIMYVLGPVARQHEFNRVNSATWYTTALALLSLLYQDGPYSMLGVTVLGVGDPIAAYVGKRFGRHKVAYGKSIEGLIGFIFSAIIASLVYLYIFHPLCDNPFVLSIVAAVTGGLAELYTHRIDDNLTIPLAAATSSWLSTYIT